MAESVNNIYSVLDRIKAEINSACEQYEISPELFWVLVRQQADYELKLFSDITDGSNND